MPTKKTTGAAAPKKPTMAQLKSENEKLKEKLEKIENGAYCHMCGTFKSKDKFYVSTNPIIKSGCTFICKECARKISERIDKNGELHEPTRESLIQALRYLDKPFLEVVYNGSIQESENLIGGRVKTNFARSYFKNIQMVNYTGMTFEDSDLFKQKIVYEDEKDEEYLKNKDVGTHDQYVRDKQDTMRLLGYDPFEKEPIDDQPFLYSQLLGMLDSSEEQQDDMLRTSSIITIVRSFLQMSRIDDAISKLMADYKNIERNAAAIKSLQESKSKIQGIITNLAAESCISLKNSKNAKKGENTWTGKIKKLKDMNLREAEINGFDLNTCRGMQQVMDMSHASILKQLRLDESEYADMIAEQRDIIVKLQKDLDSYKEISRILLRENLDLKDFLEENSMLDNENLVDLTKLYSCFSEVKEDNSLDEPEDNGDNNDK